MLTCGRQCCQQRFRMNTFLNCMKRIHNGQSLKINESLVKEVKIPLGWGHLAGKWWGNPNSQPVLALHGVQDNAATFDPLVPLLNVDAVLAVDMPGHGWSSHIPVGFLYDYMEALCVVRCLIKHYFKWSEPVVLLGHSFGSSLSFVYSALYPNEVSKYISIDCSRHQMSESPTQVISSMRNTIEKTLKIEEKSQPPEYTYEELLEMFYQGRKGPDGRITKEGCKILLSRGITKLPNGKVHLSRDPRLRLNAFGRLTLDSLLAFAPKIKCDVLSIQAENGVVKDDLKGEAYKKTVELMLKNSPKSKHVILPGHHHMHLEDPEPFANEINKFISS